MLFDLASGHLLAASLKEINIEPDINNTAIFKYSSIHLPIHLTISSLYPLIYTPTRFWPTHSSTHPSIHQSSIHYPSICLPNHPSIHTTHPFIPFIYHPSIIHLPIHPSSIHPSIYPFIHYPANQLANHLSIYNSSTHPSIHSSITYPFTCPSSIHLSSIYIHLWI